MTRLSLYCNDKKRKIYLKLEVGWKEMDIEYPVVSNQVKDDKSLKR